MGNALRTDYILGPAAGYDPYRPKANALAIQDAEATIGRKQAVGEGIRQENVLRQQDINRAPIQNEADAMALYQETRTMATPENWGAYRDFWIRAGSDPALIPEKYDENFMKQSDTEFEKYEAEEKRKDAAATAKIAREDRGAVAKIEREDRAAAAALERASKKFKFEQTKLKNKTDDTSEKDKANSARQFIQSFSTGSDSMISIFLTSMDESGKFDGASAEAAKAEVPEEQRPAYDQAIRILEKYYGVPALQSQKQRMSFTREGGLQPIK